MASFEIATLTDGTLALCLERASILFSAEDTEIVQLGWYLAVKDQYAVRSTYQDGKRGFEYAHRAIAGRMGWTAERVDHINGNGLDNRRCNLRCATHQQNGFNQRKQSRKLTSRFKGVIWDKSRGKWRAQIKHSQKSVYLGRFVSELDAARAYDAAAVDLFGAFALTNQAMYGIV